jgi:vacuolar-type H+-ATPase subunit B/Vma2
MINNKDIELLNKINSHPSIRKRVEEILNIAENTSGELITAQQAEEKAIEEIRKLGQEILKEWAVSQHLKAIDQAKIEHLEAKEHVKKNYTGNRHLEE